MIPKKLFIKFFSLSMIAIILCFFSFLVFIKTSFFLGVLAFSLTVALCGYLSFVWSKTENAKIKLLTQEKDKLLLEIEKRETFEEDLCQISLKLDESNHELDQFAYAASHDLRAPLHSILNLVAWIKEDCYTLLPESSKKHLDLIKNRVERLDNLIAGILEYSRAGKATTDFESVNSKDILIDVLDDLEKPSSISIEIVSDMPTLKASKTIMTQIFLNLISNAIKFHDKPKGHIKIGCDFFPDFYQFYVLDDGPGIDPQYHEKIFVIFQTLNARDTIESTGIGLATVKKVVEMNAGKCWVNSTVGEGATFYFTWPK